MIITSHLCRLSTEKKLLLICFAVFFFVLQNTWADTLPASEEKNRKTYSNPVDDRSLPDPTILKDKDGWYYLYATENIRHVPILRSKNLIQWEQIGTAFTKETRPDFEPKAGIWAPDINYFNKKYVMYYSMSVWGGEWTCGVGVASAEKPEGPFTDHGKLFRSNEINVQNSIDPFFIEDKGKKYLFWGSFRGIFYIELSKDGLTLKEGSKPKQIAGTAFEGTYIYKRKGYYYFFASVGSCCAGLNSTYRLVVGRSKKLLGPYVDRVGNPMMQNGFEVVIDKNENFLGNGHNAEIVQDDAGRDWMLYHGIDVNEPKKRVLMLDEILWDKDGWPYVRNSGTPSLEAAAPVFK